MKNLPIRMREELAKMRGLRDARKESIAYSIFLKFKKNIMI